MYIEGIGTIGIPISEHDVHRIIALSHKSLGNTSDTEVGTSVDELHGLDAEYIRLRHPRWPHHLREMVDDVTMQLGIARGSDIVQAELCKLQVYAPGASVKPKTKYGAST